MVGLNFGTSQETETKLTKTSEVDLPTVALLLLLAVPSASEWVFSNGI
jgi:hypothetical protein